MKNRFTPRFTRFSGLELLDARRIFGVITSVSSFQAADSSK